MCHVPLQRKDLAIDHWFRRPAVGWSDRNAVARLWLWLVAPVANPHGMPVPPNDRRGKDPPEQRQGLFTLWAVISGICWRRMGAEPSIPLRWVSVRGW